MMSAAPQKRLSLWNEAHVLAIYAAYPRKRQRGHALQAIRKALTKVSFDELLEAVQAYAESREGQDSGYTPYCASWMNGESWLDDREDWYPQKRQPEKSRASEDYDVLCCEVRRVGAGQIPSYPNQASRDAVKAMGGWQRFCDWKATEIDWRRKRFLENYIQKGIQ